MKLRKLGTTDLNLTTVGLGTWAIGGQWQFGWGPQDEKESIATILKALELGINWLDTAPIYGCGSSETVIGKVLWETSAKPIIATKCGLLWDNQLNKINNLDKASILAECEQSLKRLKVDVIDLYQIHWPVPDEKIEQAWEAVCLLRQEGKIRFGGVCNFGPQQLDRIAPIGIVDSAQSPYSLINRGVEEGLLDYCQKHKMGFLAYSPMQKGLLTGKFTPQSLETLAPDDHRRRDTNFTGVRLQKNLRFVDALKPIAAAEGCSLSALAIAWTLRRPEVTSAIVGARKPSQIAQTAGAADVVLSSETIAAIDALLQSPA